MSADSKNRNTAHPALTEYLFVLISVIADVILRLPDTKLAAMSPNRGQLGRSLQPPTGNKMKCLVNFNGRLALVE